MIAGREMVHALGHATRRLKAVLEDEITVEEIVPQLTVPQVIGGLSVDVCCHLGHSRIRTGREAGGETCTGVVDPGGPSHSVVAQGAVSGV